jgi:hypothetical protein
VRRGVITLTIYSRPGCHLCDEMEATIARVALTTPLTLEQIDISTDPALEAQYGLEIPVLIVDGKKAAKFRVSEAELLQILRGREGEGR